MALIWSSKDPNEVKDYEIDWTTDLAGDTISTSTWTIGPDSALIKQSDSKNATTTIIWLSGGTLTTTYYELTNTIVTAAGRTLVQTVYLPIVRR